MMKDVLWYNRQNWRNHFNQLIIVELGRSPQCVCKTFKWISKTKGLMKNSSFLILVISSLVASTHLAKSENFAVSKCFRLLTFHLCYSKSGACMNEKVFTPSTNFIKIYEPAYIMITMDTIVWYHKFRIQTIHG